MAGGGEAVVMQGTSRGSVQQPWVMKDGGHEGAVRWWSRMRVSVASDSSRGKGGRPSWRPSTSMGLNLAATGSVTGTSRGKTRRSWMPMLSCRSAGHDAGADKLEPGGIAEDASACASQVAHISLLRPVICLHLPPPRRVAAHAQFIWQCHPFPRRALPFTRPPTPSFR